MISRASNYYTDTALHSLHTEAPWCFGYNTEGRVGVRSQTPEKCTVDREGRILSLKMGEWRASHAL